LNFEKTFFTESLFKKTKYSNKSSLPHYQYLCPHRKTRLKKNLFDNKKRRENPQNFISFFLWKEPGSLLRAFDGLQTLASTLRRLHPHVPHQPGFFDRNEQYSKIMSQQFFHFKKSQCQKESRMR